MILEINFIIRKEDDPSGEFSKEAWPSKFDYLPRIGELIEGGKYGFILKVLNIIHSNRKVYQANASCSYEQSITIELGL